MPIAGNGRGMQCIAHRMAEMGQDTMAIESEGRQPASGFVGAAVLGLALFGLLSKRSEFEGARPVPTGAHQSAGTPVPPPGTSSPPFGAGQDGGAGAPVDHPPGLIGVGRAIVSRISRDNITFVAAAVAFYVMLAIFPALAALVSLYGLVGNPSDVASRIGDYGSLLPPEALKLITDGLNAFAQKSGSQLSLALATSVLLAIWSARSGMSAVMTGLNIAYEETERRSFIVQNLVALTLTFGAVLFTGVVVLAIAGVPIVLATLSLDQITSILLAYVRWPLLAVLVVAGFAFMYRWAPSRSHPRWRWISWGSGIATLLWLVGSFLFSFYVSKFGSFDATYGSLGAVVILLLWLWVSALVLLVGAEIDAEIDKRATEAGSPTAKLAPSAGPPQPRS